MDEVRPSGPVRVVLNPTSGSGAGRRVRAELEAALHARRVAFSVEMTRGRGHAVELAESAVRQGVPIVVAAGGDGTVHEVINGLMRAGGRTVLGLIPIGTGNDFVKVIPGTRRRSDAYDTLARGSVRQFDVARAQWQGGSEYFINAAGTGIDVEVVRQIQVLRGLPGGARYIVGLARALSRYRPVQLRIVPAGGGPVIQRRVMLAAVSNGSTVGGVFRLTPDARPDDGLLDLCVVAAVRLGDALRVAPRVMRGTHARHPSVSMARDTAFEIHSDGKGPLWMQMDGELRRLDSDHVYMKVVPGALRVLTRPRTTATGEVD